MDIGIAGLGRMGAAIGLRLIERGHRLSVWNRSPDKTKPLIAAGADLAASPAGLASRVETVITILTDAAAIDAVYLGPAGLLAGDVASKLFIEMSTVQPKTEIVLAERVRAKGAVFVECPVGGTTDPARQGKLLGLMGAEAADAARAKPLLDELCRRVEHCGPVGSGAIMKLAINLPLAVSWQAYGEAFALCRKLGFDPDRLVDLFADTSGATTALKGRAPLLAAMLKGEEIGAVTFDLASAAKDLRAMLAEGRAGGVDLPVTERALSAYEESNQASWGAHDVAGQPVYWSRRGKS
jgi:3-hydroxyisobutyrate dehydrogenase